MNGLKPHNRTRGVTLVELLVVITILMLLAAFSIPGLRGLTEDRKIREAARSLDVYISQGKTQAVEIQRPVGFVFERMNLGDENNPVLQPDACNVVRQVEVPPPYAGDIAGALMTLAPIDTDRVEFNISFVPTGGATMWDYLVEDGDQLQLNYQGRWYTITFPELEKNNKRRVRFDTSPLLSNEVLGAGLPFKVARQPQPSAVPPLRLPRDVVIDLFDSGYENTAPDTFGMYEPENPRNPMVLFAPNGSVSVVYAYPAIETPFVYKARAVMSPIFLMIGKWERTRDGSGNTLAEDGLENWRDATNLWMAINPANGFVTTAEVDTHYIDPNDGLLKDNVDAIGRSVPKTIDDSRRYAREAQISKGAL